MSSLWQTFVFPKVNVIYTLPVGVSSENIHHFLLYSSYSSSSVRRSSRKRKVDNTHAPPSTDPTAENARSLAEMLLGVMAEVVLTGLADGTIEMEWAHFAGHVTETGKISSSFSACDYLDSVNQTQCMYVQYHSNWGTRDDVHVVTRKADVAYTYMYY